MRRGGRRRAIPPTLAELGRTFARGGIGVTYDGRSWAPFVADLDLEARVADDDAREVSS